MKIETLGNGKARSWKQTTGFLLFAFCFSFFALILASCSNDIEKVRAFDRRDMPRQVLDGATVTRSEYGNLQLELRAPEIRVYDSPENLTVYPHGVEMTFFEDNRSAKAFIRADSAISKDDRDLMEAYGNVVVIDYHTGDTTYLHNIVWNTADGRLYSDTTVRSVNGHRVTYGDGFDSDDRLENLHIIRQRGTIEFND